MWQCVFAVRLWERLSAYWFWRATKRTAQGISGAPPSALKSAGHCSDWRMGSSGASLVALSYSREGMWVNNIESYPSHTAHGETDLHQQWMHLELLPQPYKLAESPPRRWDLLGEAEAVSLTMERGSTIASCFQFLKLTIIHMLISFTYKYTYFVVYVGMPEVSVLNPWIPNPDTDVLLHGVRSRHYAQKNVQKRKFSKVPLRKWDHRKPPPPHTHTFKVSDTALNRKVRISVFCTYTATQFKCLTVKQLQ